MSSNPENSLATGEVSKRSGFTREQIYSYLNAGLIKESGRTSTGRLRFDPACIERLRLIRQLNESGYTLRDIRETFKTAFRA
ncbi:MAG: MerR family transcriptional regulator [Planctomycetes bacterium]|nr:MerR family transcriptional regulator [Planctomycetota bacterium]